MSQSGQDNHNQQSNEPEYNRSGFLTFIFTMAFVLIFFIYMVVIHPGVDLDEKVRDAAIAAADAPKAVDITTIKEPWVESPEVAQYGAGVFKANCAMCHGDKGLGDGPAGAALNPKPRNLVEGKWTVGGDSISLFKTISNGIPGTSMPGFAQIKVADRWALVQYIHSITQNKTEDDAAKLNEFAASAK